MYLERQNPNGDYAAVIPRWIKKVINGEKIIIYGDGKTSRDFCPVANVVQANILAGIKQLKNKNYIFNVGTGSRISLKKLSLYIYKLLKIRKNSKKIIYKNFRKGDVKHSLSNITHIKKILGYKPNVSFENGLNSTIDWFESNNMFNKILNLYKFFDKKLKLKLLYTQMLMLISSLFEILSIFAIAH